MNVFCSVVSSGIDSEGHAANFVETEQIVLYEGAKASFVQASMRAGHTVKDYLNCLMDLICTCFFGIFLLVQILKHLTLRCA